MHQLWQSAYSCLSFLSVYWPDFSLWDLCNTIMLYQRNHAALQARRALAAKSTSVLSPRAVEFVRALREKEAEHERTLVEHYEARVRQQSKAAQDVR